MNELLFKVDARRIAAMGSEAKNKQVTSQEAEAFMLLYGEDIADLLAKTLKDFVTGKLKG